MKDVVVDLHELRDEIRRVVRAELARRERPRPRRRCGAGSAPPDCMGSAALGPDHCTCVPTEPA